jgi:hypothetical protein
MFKYLNVLGKNEEPIHLQPNKNLGHSLLSIKDNSISFFQKFSRDVPRGRKPSWSDQHSK